MLIVWIAKHGMTATVDRYQRSETYSEMLLVIVLLLQSGLIPVLGAQFSAATLDLLGPDVFALLGSDAQHAGFASSHQAVPGGSRGRKAIGLVWVDIFHVGVGTGFFDQPLGARHAFGCGGVRVQVLAVVIPQVAMSRDPPAGQVHFMLVVKDGMVVVVGVRVEAVVGLVRSLIGLRMMSVQVEA